MNQAIITTKNRNDLIKLISFVKDLKYVTAIEPVTINNTKHLSDEDWIRPGRPATDEEFEQMISKAEKEIGAGLGVPKDVAREQTVKYLKKWRTQKQQIKNIMMEIYTITIDKKEDSLKLKKVLKKLISAKVTVSNENIENPANVRSLQEFQERIKKSRKSVAFGKFLTDEEFEKETNKW